MSPSDRQVGENQSTNTIWLWYFGPLLVNSKLHEKLYKSGSQRSRWQEELACRNFIQGNRLYTERWILLVKRGRKGKEESRSHFRRALRKWSETGNIFEQFLLAVGFLFPLGGLWSGCSSYGYVSRFRRTLQFSMTHSHYYHTHQWTVTYQPNESFLPQFSFGHAFLSQQ